jgi:hypothetical protein
MRPHRRARLALPQPRRFLLSRLNSLMLMAAGSFFTALILLPRCSLGLIPSFNTHRLRHSSNTRIKTFSAANFVSMMVSLFGSSTRARRRARSPGPCTATAAVLGGENAIREAAGQARQDFYDNHAGIRDVFVRFWTFSAQLWSDCDSVIGMCVCIRLHRSARRACLMNFSAQRHEIFTTTAR